MARSFGAESLGADGFAVRGPVSAAPAVGCALVELGSNQLGWTSAPVALNSELSLKANSSGDTFTGDVAINRIWTTNPGATNAFTISRQVSGAATVTDNTPLMKMVHIANVAYPYAGFLINHNTTLPGANPGGSYLSLGGPTNTYILQFDYLAGVGTPNYQGDCRYILSGANSKHLFQVNNGTEVGRIDANGVATPQNFAATVGGSTNAAFGAGASGVRMVGNWGLHWTTQTSGAVNVFAGTVDTALVRVGTGVVGVKADNGLWVRNLANSDFAQIAASSISGTIITATTSLNGADLWVNKSGNQARLRIAGGGNEIIQFGQGGGSPTTMQMGIGGVNQAYGPYIETTTADVTTIFGTNAVPRLTLSSTGSTFSGTVESRGYQWRNSGGAFGGLLNSPSWDTSYVSLQNRNIAESASNSAINQSSAGATIVNAAAGQQLSLKVGNQTRFGILSTGECRFLGTGLTAGSLVTMDGTSYYTGLSLVPTANGGLGQLTGLTCQLTANGTGLATTVRSGLFARPILSGAQTAQDVTTVYIDSAGTSGSVFNSALTIGTPGSGNWGIYNSATPPNYFAGPLRLGATTVPGGFSTSLYVRESGSSIAPSAWRGRIVCGGDNVAFLMGEFNQQAWLGAHNAALSAWNTLKINPDGGAELHLGNLNVGAGTNPILNISNTTGVSTFSGTIAQGALDARWTVTATGKRDSQVGNGAGTWQTGYREEYNVGGVRAGFFGATPVARQSIAAAATDPATTQTLANSLRSAILNLGLGV